MTAWLLGEDRSTLNVTPEPSGADASWIEAVGSATAPGDGTTATWVWTGLIVVVLGGTAIPRLELLLLPWRNLAGRHPVSIALHLLLDRRDRVEGGAS